MPRSYPPEMRRQVVELARSGTRVKQLAETFAKAGALHYDIYGHLFPDDAREHAAMVDRFVASRV